MRTTLTRILLAFALLATFGAVGTAQASADGPINAAAGCRAAPYSASFSNYFETEGSVDLGTYTTTSQCNDINLRSTSGTSYSACVVFIKYWPNCNYTTPVPASGAWVNIATDVKDGTRFVVRVFKGGRNYVTHSGVMDF